MHIHMIQEEKKKRDFFKVPVQMEMEMNLRFNKNHPDLVEARSSGIKKAYVTLWNFLIITYFCNHQEGENLLSAGLASETQRLRNKMRKWFQFSPP